MGLVRRIISCFYPVILPEDITVIETYLDEPSKFLFYQMSKFDQQHSLAVAKTVLKKKQKGLSEKERLLLVKAALLHDVGKIEGDFDFWSRILVGIVRRFFPFIRRRLAMTNPTSWWERFRYCLYVDLIHPARGAHLARLFGAEPTVVEMIKRHHEPRRRHRLAALKYLQAADSRN